MWEYVLTRWWMGGLARLSKTEYVEKIRYQWIDSLRGKHKFLPRLQTMSPKIRMLYIREKSLRSMPLIFAKGIHIPRMKLIKRLSRESRVCVCYEWNVSVHISLVKRHYVYIYIYLLFFSFIPIYFVEVIRKNDLRDLLHRYS